MVAAPVPEDFRKRVLAVYDRLDTLKSWPFDLVRGMLSGEAEWRTPHLLGFAIGMRQMYEDMVSRTVGGEKPTRLQVMSGATAQMLSTVSSLMQAVEYKQLGEDAYAERNLCEAEALLANAPRT